MQNSQPHPGLLPAQSRGTSSPKFGGELDAISQQLNPFRPLKEIPKPNANLVDYEWLRLNLKLEI